MIGNTFCKFRTLETASVTLTPGKFACAHQSRRYAVCPFENTDLCDIPIIPVASEKEEFPDAPEENVFI